jgi:hypothetical protein
MTGADQISRFALLGNHLPRHCGIATFTTHLTDALVEQLPLADGFVVAMNDAGAIMRIPRASASKSAKGT